MNKLVNNENIDLSPFREEIDRNLKIKYTDNDILLLCRYLDEKKRCSYCKRISDCTQDSIGYAPILDEENLTLTYKACEYKVSSNMLDLQGNCIDTMYLPKKILSATLDDYHQNNMSRKQAFRYAMQFCAEYSEKNYMKGMVLYGEYGVGKTYLLAAIANQLSKRNIKTLLIYFPDLARDLKMSINDGTLEEKVNHLKTVDVLMLDDLGSEMMTNWLRDEILGPILQHRVLDMLPVFISSNCDRNMLCKHFSATRDGNDNLKGARIVKRIEDLAQYFMINKEEKTGKEKETLL